MLIRQAETSLDLNRILSLQKENTKAFLSPNEIKEQGFVTVEHSLEQLEKMQKLLPQFIAEENKQLAGYALVMPRELKKSIPVLVPMFTLLDRLTYNGKAVKDLSYYVMGQICVAKAFRGQGVLQQLYTAHKKALSQKYAFCITEISTSNFRSMKAHQKVGFKHLHHFTDAQDEWNIVIWDWTT